MTAEVLPGPASLQKLNFESGRYSLEYAPRVLEIDYSGVYVHKDGPSQDEIKSLEQMNWLEDRVPKPNLIGDSSGDFSCLVGIISTKHFDNREELDALYSKEYGRSQPVAEIERISLEKALKLLKVDISCNVDYYSHNLDEMEKDLGRKLENFDVNDKELMKDLESELLYNQEVLIFGEESDDDVSRAASQKQKMNRKRKMNNEQKSLTLRDFHLLYSDGNDKIATARRGDHYVLFYYATS